MAGTEREYRVVENAAGKEKLWWRGSAINPSEALQKAKDHISRFGSLRKVGVLHVLVPGQRFDPKLGKARHT